MAETKRALNYEPHEEWAKFPILLAPSPDNQAETVKLMVCPELISMCLQKNHRTPVYQCWAHLVATVPPVPNARLVPELADVSLTTLRDAHACFHGVKRPMGDDHDGGQIFVYLLRVDVTVEFSARLPVPCPAPKRLDDDLVLAVLVKREPGLQRGGEAIWGSVLKVELVETDRANPKMPIDSADRYRERKW